MKSLFDKKQFDFNTVSGFPLGEEDDTQGYSSLSQLVVMISGLIFTIVISVFSYNIIKKTQDLHQDLRVSEISQNIESAINGTMEEFGNFAEDLGESAENRQESPGGNIVPSNLQSRFVYLIMVTEGDRDRQNWQITPLLLPEDEELRQQTIQILKPVVNDILNERVAHLAAAPRADLVQADSRPVSLDQRGSTTEIYKWLMASILPSEEGRQKVLIGFPAYEKLFLPSNQEQINSHLDRLSLIDRVSNAPIFKHRMLNSEFNRFTKNSRRDLTVFGHNLSLDLRVLPPFELTYLGYLPYALLVFGLGLTVIGAFYVRTQSGQTARLRRLNKILSQKNYELNNEVSKREQLNATLRKSEQENRNILDTVSDIIFESDERGVIKFLNGRWPKLTRFAIADTLNTPLIDYFHFQDQEPIRNLIRDITEGVNSFGRMRVRLKIVEGQYRIVELAVSLKRKERDGKIRLVGMMTDIEDRHRAEQALSEAEKKYRAIVENAAGGIYQFSAEGQLLSANPAMARILGYNKPEELLDQAGNAYTLLFGDVSQKAKFLKEIEEKGAVKNFECEISTHRGESIWVNQNARTVRSDDGAVIYYEGSIEDITRRKQVELKLREAKLQSDMANRAKTEFLANMSHELRTPLNAIIGFSEMISGQVLGKIDNQQYVTYASDIYDSGKQLLEVINEILEVSRIEAGEREIKEEKIDMHSLAKDCMRFMDGKADEHELVINNLVDKKVPDIIAERVSVKQILLNLLSNAIKYTPAGGRVTLSYEMDSPTGALRIMISDTGIGLDQDEINKAMTPFGQGDSRLNRSNTGVGLGLTLVDMLSRLHGGSFELFSQKGIGTTATVTLPPERVRLKPVQDEDSKSGRAVDAAPVEPDIPARRMDIVMGDDGETSSGDGDKKPTIQ